MNYFSNMNSNSLLNNNNAKAKYNKIKKQVKQIHVLL